MSASDSTRKSILPDLVGSVLLDSLRADVDGDGIEELIVTSRLDENAEDDELLRDSFDRIDFYTQTGEGYRRLFVDVIEYGASITCEDITGDGVSDVQVRVDAGGNDPITAQGLHIYGLNNKGRLSLLFFSPSGAPVLRDLDNDGRSEILVSDQFWGMMARSEVIGFTREVYAFDGGSYILANEAFSKWFDSILKARRRDYEKARGGGDNEEGRAQLYTKAAEYLVWNLARGGTARLNTVWHTEEAFLRQRLSEEQFGDLETFVDDVNTMEYEQSGQRIS
ncbi:MAG: hypothetical protein WAV84_01805 [Bacteroidota bacterium]